MVIGFLRTFFCKILVTMWRAGQSLYSSWFGQAGNEETLSSPSCSSFSNSLSSNSGTSLEADAEEVDDRYGSAEGSTGASSSNAVFRASDSDADGRGRRTSYEGESSTTNAESRVETVSRELASASLIDDDGRSPPHHTQSLRWSRRGIILNGLSVFSVI